MREIESSVISDPEIEADTAEWEHLSVRIGGLIHDANNKLTAVLGHADLNKDGMDKNLDDALTMIIDHCEKIANINKRFLTLFRKSPTLTITEKLSELQKLMFENNNTIIPQVEAMQQKLDELDNFRGKEILTHELSDTHLMYMQVKDMDDHPQQEIKEPTTVVDLKMVLEYIKAEQLDKTMVNGTKRVSIQFDTKNSTYALVPSQLLDRSISNLIINSIRHGMGDRDGIEINVSLTRESIKDKSYAVITVRDNGTGIPKENQAKLLKGAGFTTGGTGFGLDNVKAMATSCGGDLKFSSEEGKGSEFKIYLPELDMAAGIAA